MKSLTDFDGKDIDRRERIYPGDTEDRIGVFRVS
jgi:hypothetical protein